LTESFLHYIWQYQYFNKEALQTTEGEVLQIFHPGMRNANAGPDFSEARIKIGQLEWRGSVEIHIQASGWKQHQHDVDQAYEKVVLHVVWEDDKPVFRTDGTLMPTLILNSRVNPDLWSRYRNLFTSPENIPCGSQWRTVPEIIRVSALEQAVVQRTEKKSEYVNTLLKSTNGDWEETCYQIICRNFGFKINAEGMMQLARAVPYRILLKHIDKQEQVEALLFGMAGFLDQAPEDSYVNILKREFTVLKAKYSLASKQMHESQWNLLRLRPANFPTVRIAQLAALLVQKKNIFSHILDEDSYDGLVKVFQAEQSSYWQTHYVFGKQAGAKVPVLGKAGVHHHLINTVVPVLVAYGKLQDDSSFIERSFTILQHIPGEQNKITKQWKAMGAAVRTSFDSQGYLELYHSYCLKRRCLDCAAGAYLVKREQS
jgi:hypothetical protein